MISDYTRVDPPLRTDWAGPDGPVGAYIREESGRTLQAYCSQPSLVAEHANQEQDTARGGYAHRQIVELVQNAADQLIETGSHISIRLTQRISTLLTMGARSMKQVPEH